MSKYFLKKIPWKDKCASSYVCKTQSGLFLSESFLKRKEELDRKTKPASYALSPLLRFFFAKIFCVCLIANRIFLDHLTFKAAQLLDPSEGLKKWKFQGSGYVFFNNCIDIYWYWLTLTDTIWPLPPCINATISIIQNLQYNFPNIARIANAVQVTICLLVSTNVY